MLRALRSARFGTRIRFLSRFRGTQTVREMGTTDEATAQALRDIEEAHDVACRAGESRYIDPATGYKVFTSDTHVKRGFCCGNACRCITHSLSSWYCNGTVALAVQR